MKLVIKEETLNEDEFSKDQLERLKSLIRYEMAQIMFDLYRKKSVWSK